MLSMLPLLPLLLLPPSAWVLAAHQVPTRLHAGLQEVTWESRKGSKTRSRYSGVVHLQVFVHS